MPFNKKCERGKEFNMSTLNLVTKYAKNMVEKFRATSIVAGKTSEEFDFIGAETIKVMTPVVADLVDYSRTGINRYGNTVEIGDTVQEMKVTQDKGFSASIDKGNALQQDNVKTPGKMLREIIETKIVPMTDKRALQRYALLAGKVAAVAAPTKSTIVEMLMDAEVAFNEAGVPYENRYCVIRPDVYKLVRLAPEFTGTNDLANKAVEKGVIGQVGTLKIIQASMSRLPENCYFLCWQKKSVILPFQINDAKYNNAPQGISGVLLEGRVVYDAFVIGTLSAGVYAAVASVAKVAKPVMTAGGNTVTVTCATAGATVFYTLDGSDPRYSPDAKVYTGAVTLTEG
ncbi:MAG: hypothetical protein BGN88_01450, partial [Clostridiales bacterium 43-6]